MKIITFLILAILIILTLSDVLTPTTNTKSPIDSPATKQVTNTKGNKKGANKRHITNTPKRKTTVKKNEAKKP